MKIYFEKTTEKGFYVQFLYIFFTIEYVKTQNFEIFLFKFYFSFKLILVSYLYKSLKVFNGKSERKKMCYQGPML